MDPFSVATGAVKAVTLTQKIAKLIPSSKQKIAEAWQEQIEDVALEANAAVQRLTENLGDEAIAQIEARLHTRAVQAFVRVLFDAAIHSVTRERMVMLCAALASGAVLDEAAEMKSRVARAVTMLEPSDVVLLRKLVAEHGSLETALQFNLDGAAALTQAGCLIYSPPSNQMGFPTTGLSLVTEVGRALLRFVETWNSVA